MRKEGGGRWEVGGRRWEEEEEGGGRRREEKGGGGGRRAHAVHVLRHLCTCICIKPDLLVHPARASF